MPHDKADGAEVAGGNGLHGNSDNILWVDLEGHEEFYNLQDVLRLFYGIGAVIATPVAELGSDNMNLEHPNSLHVTLPANTALAKTVGKDAFRIKSSLQQLDANKQLVRTELVIAGSSRKVLEATLDNKSVCPAQMLAESPQDLEEAAIGSLLTAKRMLKKQLYDLLCDIEGLAFPWGSLTGIRPTYVACEIYQLLYALYHGDERDGSDSVGSVDSPHDGGGCHGSKVVFADTCEDFVALSKRRLNKSGYQDNDLWKATAKYLQLLYGLSAPKARLACLTARQENTILAACYERSASDLAEFEEAGNSDTVAKTAGSASAVEKRNSVNNVLISTEPYSPENRSASANLRSPELLSVYIGIPFCATRCAYCSFAPRDGIRADKAAMDSYVSHLIYEIEQLFPAVNVPIQTLYIGGGTPSALDAANLERLFNCLQSQRQWGHIYEKTFEAGRADTIDVEKLKLVKAAGFDHICVNPQTFNDATLKRIGRSAYRADIEQVMRTVRDLEFPVCNMDLIFGLPGEGRSDMLASLHSALAFAPENITLHTLAFKRKSWLGQMRQNSQAVPLQLRENSTLGKFVNNVPALSYVSSDLHEALQEAQDLLEQAGYLPYYMYRQKDALSALENTGFAKVGAVTAVNFREEGQGAKAFAGATAAAATQSATSALGGNLYNVLMMSDQTSILGFGACAMSKFKCGNRIERFSNARSVQSYAEKYEEHLQIKLKLIKEYL